MIVQRLGETLRQFLDEADWEAMESQLPPRPRQNREVVLTIRSAAAELYALPWGLPPRNTGQHIAELPRSLSATSGLRPRPPRSLLRRCRESGRILFAWSAAAGAVSRGGAACRHRVGLPARATILFPARPTCFRMPPARALWRC